MRWPCAANNWDTSLNAANWMRSIAGLWFLPTASRRCRTAICWNSSRTLCEARSAPAQRPLSQGTLTRGRSFRRQQPPCLYRAPPPQPLAPVPASPVPLNQQTAIANPRGDPVAHRLPTGLAVLPSPSITASKKTISGVFNCLGCLNPRTFNSWGVYFLNTGVNDFTDRE